MKQKYKVIHCPTKEMAESVDRIYKTDMADNWPIYKENFCIRICDNCYGNKQYFNDHLNEHEFITLQLEFPIFN